MMHVLALVFELAIGAATVMSLLSNMRHPDRQASPEAKRAQSEQVVATVASLGSTLVTFVFTMMGAGDAVQGLRAIATRISAVGQRTSAAGQRMSTTRQTLSSVGQNISKAGSYVARRPSFSGRRSHAPCETGSEQLLMSPYASDGAHAE